MKKSLLALAVLGAFAGLAQAQTNVVIYGIVDVSVASTDDGDERTLSMDSGRNAASRIGFKGTEDLGNGLKANFLLENGFDASNGNQAGGGAGAFSRLAYLGLGGGFGEVRLGRQNSSYKTALDVIDPFKGGGMGAAIGYMNFVPTAAGVLAPEFADAAGGANNAERISNALTYISPKFGGFQGSAQYVFGETRGENSANRGVGAQLGYENGPLAVQFGYSNFNSTDEEAGVVATTDIDVENLFAGATYNFGVAKLHAGFQHTKLDDEIGGGSLKGRSYLVGATVPFGASAIRASYIMNDARDFDDADSNMAALSYTYSMSKRTTLYATYVRTDNDTFADVGFDGDPSVAGEKTNSFAVGVQHNF